MIAKFICSYDKAKCCSIPGSKTLLEKIQMLEFSKAVSTDANLALNLYEYQKCFYTGI